MLFMNLLLGQFCESLTFASAALVILYTRVRGLLQEMSLIISHAASARFNDHGLISLLETRLEFRIGKVFANHADTTLSIRLKLYNDRMRRGVQGDVLNVEIITHQFCALSR